MPGLRGTNQSGMRAYNERLVLSLVRRHGALAKAEIARMTGLSAQTVSVIMRALELDGLLRKGKPQRGKVGQPSIPMSLAPDGAYFLGLKVGRRSADMVLIDFLGRVIASRRETFAHPLPDRMIAFATRSVVSLRAELAPDHANRIGGIGIAIPFLLWDWAPAIDAPQAEMDAWRGADLRAEIAAATGLPVYLRNDASAACGAELVFGEVPAARDFLYFYVGYFIGGGVVLNGSLYTGLSGNAGALGSMPVPGPDGQSRQLIDFASLSVLERALRTRGLPSGTIWDSSEIWAIPADLLDAWIEEAAQALAHAILSASSVIDFQQVLIDGWLPPAIKTRLVADCAARLTQMNHAGLTLPQVSAGQVGPNARALGAASIPLAEAFLVDQHALWKD